MKYTNDELERRGWRLGNNGSPWAHPDFPWCRTNHSKVMEIEAYKDAAIAAERKRCAEIATAMAQRCTGDAETAARCIANLITATP